MEEKKINVKLPDAPPGTVQELIIREGDAPKLNQPEKVVLSGNIHSVKEFLAKGPRYGTQEIRPGFAVVVTDFEQGFIQLKLDPESPIGCEVIGKLETAPELAPFGINKGKTFKREELVKLLRFSRLFFPDTERHAEIVTAFSKFNARAHYEMQQESDTRGNRTSNFEKKVHTDLPLNFVLEMPIYKGFPNERFMVEVCLEVTDAGATFWFESVELAELLQVRKEAIFADQLIHCEAFPIINK